MFHWYQVDIFIVDGRSLHNSGDLNRTWHGRFGAFGDSYTWNLSPSPLLSGLSKIKNKKKSARLSLSTCARTYGLSAVLNWVAFCGELSMLAMWKCLLWRTLWSRVMSSPSLKHKLNRMQPHAKAYSNMPEPIPESPSSTSYLVPNIVAGLLQKTSPKPPLVCQSCTSSQVARSAGCWSVQYLPWSTGRRRMAGIWLWQHLRLGRK